MPRAQKGQRFGGRTKGTPNKSTQAVADKLKEMGADPIDKLARIMNQAFDEGDFELAFKAARELAQYVAPKRKAIEIDADVTIHDEVMELTDEELLQEMKELGFIAPED